MYGETGENEGILTPGDSRYWYESAGEYDLEMLQVLAINPEKVWRVRIMKMQNLIGQR